MIKNSIAVLIGLFVVFIFLEIFVRIAYPQARSLFIADPYIRTIHKPNVVTIKEGPGFTAEIRTNAQGFVGDDFTIDKPDNTFRIAMLGDSITEGFQVNYDQSFSVFLEEELNKNASDSMQYQVYNFGISGSSTIHELLTYRHYIAKYSPDLVVWQFYIGNDYADNLLLRTDPHATVANAPEIKWGKLRAFLSNDLHSPRFVVRNLEKLKKIKDVMHISGISARQLSYYNDENNYPFIYDVYNVGRPTLFDEEYENTCKIIKELKDEILNNDTKILSIVVPVKVELYPDEWQKFLDRYPAMTKEEWDFQKPELVMEDCLNGNEMTYVKFYDIFKKLVDDNQPKMYYEDDLHFNEFGHHVVANTLSEIIPELLNK